MSNNEDLMDTVRKTTRKYSRGEILVSTMDITYWQLSLNVDTNIHCIFSLVEEGLQEKMKSNGIRSFNNSAR